MHALCTCRRVISPRIGATRREKIRNDWNAYSLYTDTSNSSDLARIKYIFTLSRFHDGEKDNRVSIRDCREILNAVTLAIFRIVSRNVYILYIASVCASKCNVSSDELRRRLRHRVGKENEDNFDIIERLVCQLISSYRFLIIRSNERNSPRERRYRLSINLAVFRNLDSASTLSLSFSVSPFVLSFLLVAF